MSTPNDPSALDAIFDDPEFREMYGSRRVAAPASTEDGRIIAAFGEISDFVDENQREPTEDDDVSLAVRLETFRGDARLKTLLAPYDRHGILGHAPEISLPTTMDEILELDDPIFGGNAQNDIFELVHVSDRSGSAYADDAATRTRCENFDAYRPVFDRLTSGLKSGSLVTKRELDNSIQRRGAKRTVLGISDLTIGAAFILNGVIAFIADRKEGIERTINRVKDAELHIVFENGTEAKDYLARSLARKLLEDPNGRQIVDVKSGLPVNVDPSHADLPIFGGALTLGPDDLHTGTLYVVESLSQDPQIVELKGKLFKIGFTTQKLSLRLANAEADATFLFAPVNLVAHYTIANARPAIVEKIVHEFFAPARLNILVHLGRKVEPREWFVVPLEQVKRAMPMIVDRTITSYRYDRNSQTIVRK